MDWKDVVPDYVDFFFPETQFILSFSEYSLLFVSIAWV